MMFKRHQNWLLISLLVLSMLLLVACGSAGGEATQEATPTSVWTPTAAVFYPTATPIPLPTTVSELQPWTPSVFTKPVILTHGTLNITLVFLDGTVPPGFIGWNSWTIQSSVTIPEIDEFHIQGAQRNGHFVLYVHNNSEEAVIDYFVNRKPLVLYVYDYNNVLIALSSESQIELPGQVEVVTGDIFSFLTAYFNESNLFSMVYVDVLPGLSDPLFEEIISPETACPPGIWDRTALNGVIVQASSVGEGAHLSQGLFWTHQEVAPFAILVTQGAIAPMNGLFVPLPDDRGDLSEACFGLAVSMIHLNGGSLLVLP